MNRGFSLFQGEVVMHHLKKLPACLDRSPKLCISRKPRRQVSETYAGRMERLPLRDDQT